VSESNPGESVNDCRDIESLLAAYVDGEAVSCDCDRVRQHVESCPGCRDRMMRQRAARDAVRARRTGLRACASPDLKARCASLAASGSPASRRPGYVDGSSRIPPSFVRRWAPLSVAATLVLAIATVFGFGLNDKVQALAFQTTIDHVKCSRFSAPAGSADAAETARQWQAKSGWPITAPASSVPERLELHGVRRCAVMDGRVAHLMYTWLGEPLSVYVLPKRTLADGTEFVRRFGHNSVMWSRNDRTYIMVTSHRRDPDFDKVVAYVRANAF
jgi:anti-sigma factor RsiW